MVENFFSQCEIELNQASHTVAVFLSLFSKENNLGNFSQKNSGAIFRKFIS